MNPEKISSLHDDLLVPKAMEHLGEYRDYPDRFDPKDKSVLTRLEQFGVDLKTAAEIFGKEIKDFTWEDYTRLVGEAIKARYDVIVGSVFDQYMFPNPEKPSDGSRWEKMLGLVEKYREMGEGVGLNLIKQKSDFGNAGNLVLGLEAGAHLINTLDDVKKLESHGIKIFGLQYNKDTPLATSGGLTKLGQEAAQYLFHRNLIIDLAHAGYKTRQDIMNIAEDSGKGGLVSYTHGSAEEDITEAWKNKMGERALKKAEIERLVKMGGIIGLGVTEPFFSGTRKLAERINETLQLDNGLERVAIGTDFGGVPPMFLTEIKTPEDFKILADVLSEQFNLNDENIDKILRGNARAWLENAID